MSYSIAELQLKSDAELIAEHDRHARNTVVGTGYFQDELERRARVRSMEATDRLARRSFWLGVSSTVLSFIATAVAVVALVLQTTS